MGLVDLLYYGWFCSIPIYHSKNIIMTRKFTQWWSIIPQKSTKTNNHLIEHKENPRHMALEIQILILDMHKSVAELNRLVVIYLLGHSKSLSYELSWMHNYLYCVRVVVLGPPINIGIGCFCAKVETKEQAAGLIRVRILYTVSTSLR